MVNKLIYFTAKRLNGLSDSVGDMIVAHEALVIVAQPKYNI